MSIFDSIKNAIFGHAAKASVPVSKPTAPAATPAPTPPAGTAPRAAPAPSPPQSVDIEETLNALNSKNSQKLNWQSSIVDLMKLVGLDSSLEHRKALAKELGYTGDTSDSAAMNIWLHKQVMKKLAENGGKVPASLQH